MFENVVARDGIEPPTPAFSGLASLIVNLLIRFAMDIIFALETASVLE